MKDEAIHKKLLEHMNEAVCMTNTKSCIVYANPKLCNILWYKTEELEWKSANIFLTPESQQEVARVDREERAQGMSSSYSIVLLTKNKKFIPVTLNGTTLPDGGTIGIMTDMRRIERQENIYRKLIEHMDEAVCMTDENQNILYTNPKLCNLLWVKPEDLIGKPADIFLDTESKRKVKHVNEKERQKWISSNYDINIITKLWNVIPVNLNGTPIPGGGTIGIMTDLREMKAKEENEKVLYNAVQFSTDGIIICDTSGVIKFWNKGTQMIFGRKHDEVIQKNISIIFWKKDINMILKDSEGITKYELKGKHKNKSALDISMTQSPILDSKKKNITSYLLICRDITDHRKIEEEIESKYKKIREVYQSIGIIKRQWDYIFDLLELFEKYHYDLKSIGDFIVTSVIMLTRVDACAVRIYEEKSQKLKMISSFGFSEWWEGKSSINYKNSLAEKAFKNNSPLKIMDISKEPLYQSISLARKNNVTSLLLIPLKNKWQIIGTLSLYTKADKKLEVFENEFIEKYAKVIQIVLANSL